MSRVSIVVPVYKVEKYLKRCVDSIFHQTVSDFDLVLVDDGSPDRCPELCDEIAQSDSRVVVIHQKNGGLSAARNSGIEWALANSGSEWITFIDSDDWVHPQYLECFLHAVQTTEIDVCLCRFYTTSKYVEDFETITNRDFSVMRTEDAFRMEELDPNSACGRLFWKELFRNLRFPVGKLHEDRYTTYQVLFRSPKVGVIEKPMYFYYMNPEGIVHSEWTPRKLDDLEATEQQLAFFQKTGNAEMYAYTVRDYINLMVYNLKILKGNSEYRSYQRQIRQKLRRTLSQEKKTIGLSFREDFRAYKYAYPVLSKIYRRLRMR